MSLVARFSRPDVHRMVFADDFYADAAPTRDELLAHREWGPMTQYGRSHELSILPHRQNGICALEDAAHRLPRVDALRDHVGAHAAELCATLGVTVARAGDLEVESGAMAYGEGCWLSPHTDHRDDEARPRLVAWMLYLTHPEDGEWPDDRGGALRLVARDGAVARLRPRFNRFAMFAVSPDSVHEIEPITGAAGWDRSRLAVSGWIRGPEERHEQRTLVYLRRSSAAEDRAREITRLTGLLAMHRLLLAQRASAGVDTADASAKLTRYGHELDAHRAAPEGTVFSRFARGPRCIMVLDEAQKVVFWGPSDAYPGGTSDGA